jgi:hypothetical protein
MIKPITEKRIKAIAKRINTGIARDTITSETMHGFVNKLLADTPALRDANNLEKLANHIKTQKKTHDSEILEFVNLFYALSSAKDVAEGGKPLGFHETDKGLTC